jgi:hypothetical protein
MLSTRLATNKQYLRRCSIESSRETRYEIRMAHTEGRIVETETEKVADGRDIADTTAVHPADASGDINLLLKRPGGNLEDINTRQRQHC